MVGFYFSVSTFSQGWLQKANFILTGGKGGGSFNAILEYDVAADSFTQIRTMTKARSWHAISVVKYEDFSKNCP